VLRDVPQQTELKTNLAEMVGDYSVNGRIDEARGKYLIHLNIIDDERSPRFRLVRKSNGYRAH
jgi:hypothetical protein